MTNTTQTEQTTVTGAAGGALSVPAKWMRFFARILHLKPGRYTITLSVYGDRCDWSISEGAKIEH